MMTGALLQMRSSTGCGISPSIAAGDQHGASATPHLSQQRYQICITSQWQSRRELDVVGVR